MADTLIMSTRELGRISILERVIAGAMTTRDAAEALDLSERQVYRLSRRFRSLGAAGLTHGLRGRPSNARAMVGARRSVLALYRERYADYGPTLFCEQLETVHGLVIGTETARRWLLADGQWRVAARPHRHRRKRPRRTAIGAMVQFDGSPHAWFEDRGPACTLLVLIDDASSRVFLRFVRSENTEDCLRVMREYVERHGIPQSLYVDFGTVYKEARRPTQFVRAMTALGVRMIYAHSPQAKGRVERSNRTHQDRLIKALRQEKIGTIAAANAFLDRWYLAAHNARFASEEGLTDVHRPADGIDLDKIFCLHETRSVGHDHTIQLHARYLQLLPSKAPLPPPKQRVLIRTFLDGTRRVYWNEEELGYECVRERPRKAKKPARTVPADHAWRIQNTKLKSARQRTSRERLMTAP